MIAPDPVRECVIPTAMCFAASAAFGAAVRTLGRRHVAFGASLLATTFFAWLLWRYTQWSAMLIGLMLVCSLGVPALGATRLRRSHRALPPILGLALTAVLPVGGLLTVTLPFSMHEDIADVRASPDGRYKAILSYRDGLTYGFGHVLIERKWQRGWWPRDEIAEVDDEGLSAIKWLDTRTLLIRHSCPDEQLCVRLTRYDRLRIVYERAP